MSDYTQKLHALVNDPHRFVRCFYGVCPECKKRIFSVKEQIKGSELKAYFICDCGKKWKETVYSAQMKKYKYPQALVDTYRDKKRGEVKVLRRLNRIWLVTPDKVLTKEIKR